MTTPRIIAQGDTVEWTVSLSEYPATEWLLNYYLINTSGKITLTGSPNGTDHEIKLAATDTATYIPGDYRWTAKVTDIATSSIVHTVGVGDMTVTPDVSSLNTYDPRSWAEIALENVEAVLANRATLDQESYSIQGRSLSRTPIQDLINLRKYLQAEVSTQNDIINGTNSKKAVVRF